MKPIAGFAIAVLFTASALRPATPADERTDAQIEAIVRDYLAHAGDVAANDRFWSADLVYTDSLGGRSGKKDVLDSVAAARASRGDEVFTHEAKDMRVHRYGDSAVVAFTLLAHAAEGSAIRTRTHMITAVLHRERGTWRSVAWQSTDPRP